MITPVMIQIVFWLGELVIFILAMKTIFGGSSAPVMPQSPFGGPVIQQSSGNGFLDFCLGVLILVLGTVFWRVYCELLIVIFKILGELVAIRNGTPPTPEARGFPVSPLSPPNAPL